MDIGELILSKVTGDGQEKAKEMILASQTSLLDKVDLIFREVLWGTNLPSKNIEKVRKSFMKRFSKEILKLET
jgi:hypothetical protein